MIRCLRTTRSARARPSPSAAPPSARRARSALRPRAASASRPPSARHAEHLRDPRGERRRPRAERPVLADRERQEVDGLQVLVYGVAANDRLTLVRGPLTRPSTCSGHRRAVARPFRYEVPDGVGARSGRRGPVRPRAAARRGHRVGVEAPARGGDRAPGRVLGELPPALVDLALWLASYYGSTPARALTSWRRFAEAARRPARRRADVLEARRGPSVSDRRRPSAWRRGARLGRRSTSCSRRDRERQDRGLPPGVQAALGARARRDRARAEIALTPQAVGRFRARFGDGVAFLHSGLTDAERRDERVRILAGEARVVVGARSAVFAPVARLGPSASMKSMTAYKQESDPRYDARTVAAKRGALEGAVALYGSATPRPESWERLERLELGGASAARSRRSKSSTCGARPATRSRRRFSRSSAGREGGREGDPAPEPPRHRARAALPRLRRHDPVRALRRLARAARRRRLRCHHCGSRGARPRRAPRASRPSWPDRRGRSGWSASSRAAARARADSHRRRHRRRPEALGRARALRGDRPRRPARHADGREGPPLRGRRAAAVVDADTGLALPDFRAEERTFQLVTRSPAERARRAGPRARPDLPARRAPIALAARHDVTRFLAGARAPPRARLPAVQPPRPYRRLGSGRRSGHGARRAAGAEGGRRRPPGPAPLAAPAGRHRAQLVAKTDQPERLPPGSAPGSSGARRCAGKTHGGRGRRPTVAPGNASAAD